MEPGSRNSPREQGSWDGPGRGLHGYPSADPAELSYVADGPKRGRPGRVALVVLLVEFLIIAAACNQSLTKHEFRYFLDHPNSFLGRAVQSLTTFAWRFTPQSGDNRGGVHALWSQLTTIGVFLVVSVLLTGVAVRGAVTFGRAFLGIWTGTIVAALVGRAVGALVTRSPLTGTGKGTYAVFVAPGGSAVFAGLAIGLVAAVFGALVAVASRRDPAPVPVHPSPQPAPQAVPEAPPPFYGDGPGRYPTAQPDPYAPGQYTPAAGQYAPSAGQYAAPAPGPYAAPQPGAYANADQYAPQPDPHADSATVSFPSLAKDPTDGEARTEQVPAPATAPAPEVPASEQNRTSVIPRFDPQGGQNWTPPEPGQGSNPQPGEGQPTQGFPVPPPDDDHR